MAAVETAWQDNDQDTWNAFDLATYDNRSKAESRPRQVRQSHATFVRSGHSGTEIGHRKANWLAGP